MSEAPIPGAQHLHAVAALLEHHLGEPAAKITAATHLADDLHADSLDALEIAIAAERQFGIEISEDEIAATATVADILALLAAKRAAPAVQP